MIILVLLLLLMKIIRMIKMVVVMITTTATRSVVIMMVVMKSERVEILFLRKQKRFSFDLFILQDALQKRIVLTAETEDSRRYLRKA